MNQHNNEEKFTTGLAVGGLIGAAAGLLAIAGYRRKLGFVQQENCTWVWVPEAPGAIGVEDPINLRSRPRGVTIRWRIEEADADVGWRFDSDGITFKTPSNQFSQSRPSEGRRRWRVRNENSDSKEYLYIIRLINERTGERRSLDPAVWNGPRIAFSR